MEINFVEGAARIYYSENVEGEPLDQDTPIECFIAGANFILTAQKIHANNCNNLYVSPYKSKIVNMNKSEKLHKILTNVEKIIKVKGFYITAPGDPSVGIYASTWELRNDFYFDTQAALEEFQKELKSLFEFYCGEVTNVITFEEYQKLMENEELEFFQQYPIRYLLRDKDSNLSNYKQADSTASYSSDIGTAIHCVLPRWMPVEGDSDTEVIKSSEPRFKQILLIEAERLEREIKNEEYKLSIAKRNLTIIQNELNLGLK